LGALFEKSPRSRVFLLSSSTGPSLADCVDLDSLWKVIFSVNQKLDSFPPSSVHSLFLLLFEPEVVLLLLVLLVPSFSEAAREQHSHSKLSFCLKTKAKVTNC